jgi:hypothetical protein
VITREEAMRIVAGRFVPRGMVLDDEVLEDDDWYGISWFEADPWERVTTPDGVHHPERIVIGVPSSVLVSKHDGSIRVVYTCIWEEEYIIFSAMYNAAHPEGHEDHTDPLPDDVLPPICPMG